MSIDYLYSLLMTPLIGFLHLADLYDPTIEMRYR